MRVDFVSVMLTLLAIRIFRILPQPRFLYISVLRRVVSGDYLFLLYDCVNEAIMLGPVMGG